MAGGGGYLESGGRAAELCGFFIAECAVAAVSADGSDLVVILRTDSCGGIGECRAVDGGYLVKLGVAAGSAVDLIAGCAFDCVPRKDYLALDAYG